jgi:hypothetical protein
VVVVVNGDSWASAALADAYARLRGIPATSVVTLGGLRGFETIGLDLRRNAARSRRVAIDQLPGLLHGADTRGDARRSAIVIPAAAVVQTSKESPPSLGSSGAPTRGDAVGGDSFRSCEPPSWAMSKAEAGR